MASFVLIHGAFQSGFVWRAAGDMLARAGHDVLIPGLTGLGDRAHLLRQGITLADYVNDVVNAVCYAKADPPVFVGHSYSGLIAAAAAARLPQLAAGLVYVDALIPEIGRSFMQMAGPDFGKVLNAHTHDGWLVRPWPLQMFGVVETQLTLDFASRLSSMPLAAFTASYDFATPDRNLSKAYIRCLRNPNPLIAAQAAKAKAAGMEYTEIDSHHAPMVTAPALLVSALERFAATVPKPSPLPGSFYSRHMMRTPPARPGENGDTTP